MTRKFPTNIKEARKYQEILAEKVLLTDDFSEIKTVGAFDIAYKKNNAFAAGIIYDFRERKIIEETTVKETVKFPYIPTYLFLREVPSFLSLFDKLSVIPDVIIIDGHGIAHPRVAGSATIFGVITDMPTIGVAKKPLKSFTYKDTNQSNLDKIYLYQKHVGFRQRFTKKWNPIYISPGNKISFESSYNVIKELRSNNFKLPIPQQYAHLLAAKFKESST